MRVQGALLTCLAAVSLSAALGRSDPIEFNQLENQVGEPDARVKYQLSDLFDFNNYKKLFKKSYRSPIEEANRRSLFLANAFRTSVTRTKYESGQLRHFEPLNHMSDYTPQELDQMTNKVLAQWSLLFSEPDASIESSSEVDGKFQPAAGKAVRAPAKTRRRRDVEAAGRAAYGNALLGAPRLSEQLVNPLLWSIEPPAGDSLSSEGPVTPAASGQESGDAMIFDHRDSNCFFKPPDQGKCGCCYAFATVTIMEWLHCRRTGKLVAFSEQYLVDCGNERFFNAKDSSEMRGCDGATGRAVVAFVHNFGMELRSEYRYRARERSCFYPKHYNLTQTGYMRFESRDFVELNQIGTTTCPSSPCWSASALRPTSKSTKAEFTMGPSARGPWVTRWCWSAMDARRARSFGSYATRSEPDGANEATTSWPRRPLRGVWERWPLSSALATRVPQL